MSIAAVEQQNPRLRIVAMKRNDERVEMIPAPKTKIEPGDFAGRDWRIGQSQAPGFRLGPLSMDYFGGAE